MAKRPSKANADRQPRQSNGQAIPPIKPAIPPELAPKPAPGPPAMGPRGINVGLRLKKLNLSKLILHIENKLTQHID